MDENIYIQDILDQPAALRVALDRLIWIHFNLLPGRYAMVIMIA
jgi:hypothetical protein